MLSFILDTATTQPDQFYNSPWFATVAGLVGVAIGGAISFLPIQYAAKLAERQEDERAATELRARREALNVELGHILETIAEINDMMKMSKLPAKLLSWDFLEACRLDWYKVDSDTVFIKALAKAYHDVVLTNEMLNYGLTFIRDLAKQGQASLQMLKGVSESLVSPLEDVRGSITALKKLTEEKLAVSPR
jgi:hypothetical protein